MIVVTKMAESKCIPPGFGGHKSYERWKAELDLWRRVTPVGKKKQAMLIALSFADDSEVRDRIFNEIPADELDCDDGMSNLLSYMDTWYKKDELTTAYDSWTEFDNIHMGENTTMEAYITSFEKKYKNISKHNLVIPSSILAFKLLDRSGLPHRDKQLVLTGVNYTTPDTMLTQMIAALRKFFGREAGPSGSDVQNQAIAIKSEPVYTTDAEEVNKTAHWKNKMRYTGDNRGQGGARGRGSWRSMESGRGPAPWNSRGGGRGHPQWNDVDGRGQRKNPMDWYGNVTTCHVCNSEYHYSFRCPKRKQNTYERVYEANTDRNFHEEGRDNDETYLGGGSETAYIACGDRNNNELRKLVSETFNCAILDSACSSTVCGVDWMESYLESLPNDKLGQVIEEESKKTFKFGDGVVVPSLKKVTFPCVVAGNRINLKCDVVDTGIPLLLGKPSMKKAKVKLDLGNDSAIILGKYIKLRCTPSGHYCIPLTDESFVGNIKEVLFTEGLDNLEKKKMVLKLHQQFGHPSVKRLRNLLADAGVKDKICFDIVENITDGCNICRKYKRTPSRPVVSLPLARDFNEVVAMDLKEWKKGEVYFLHLVDVATRFCRSAVIYDKKRKTIIDKVIEIWIGTGIGCPEKFLADNGGEFANEEFTDMCENLNIRVMHTAAQSPFSNGLCERNHAVIDDMVAKIMADQPECSIGTALAWAIHAKNSLQMVGGYSPYQLVFGRNPKLPCVMNDSLPALEGTTISETLGKHLSALHAGRMAFIKAETSEKIRRALRHQVRPSGRIFQNGELVYYKRDDNQEWKGPGTIIGQDGKIVIIKHGSYIVRIHVSRVIEVNYDLHADIENGKREVLDEIRNNLGTQSKPTGHAPNVPFEFEDGESSGAPEREEENGGSEDDGQLTRPVVSDNTRPAVSVVSDNIVIPKVGMRVKYLPCDSEEWKTAKVVSRAGKATGMYRNWLNIHDDDGEEKSIDWRSGVRQWAEEPQNCTSSNLTLENNEVFLSTSNLEDRNVMQAKSLELDNWKKFKVYEEVPNRGQPSISVRWVCTEKLVNGETKVKARLVARGFEDPDQVRSDSPTGDKAVLRIFLSIIASKKWKCNSIDIKAAFLQGEDFQREVFLKPPKEAEHSENVLWKLKKCVYGLNDAARMWYFTVKTFLFDVGCKQLKVDPAGFYWYHEGELSGVLLMHVDDFIWGGTRKFESDVIEKIRSVFQVGQQSSGVFKYIGLEVKQDEHGINLSQKHYLQNVKSVPINAKRACNKLEDCNETEKENFRSLVGQIGWLGTNTRPDVSYDVLNFSCLLNHPKVGDIIEANKCLRKLDMMDCTLKFSNLGDLSKAKIITFSDASHANLPDGYSSAGGFIIFLVGENGKSCPLAWEAKKMRRVVKSTLAAETLAASDAVDMSYYLGSVLSEVLFNVKDSNVIHISCFVDNQSLVENVHSTKNVSEKRLRIDLAALKQLVQEGYVIMKWIESGRQLSDCLTKKGASSYKLLNVLQIGKLDL